MKLLKFILLILLPIFSFSQLKNVNDMWKSIDKKIDEGKFSSVLPDLILLKQQAVKQKKDPDIIKATIYEAKIKLVTQEESKTDNDGVNYIFKSVEDLISGKSVVNDAIVKAYLAELYFIYYNENSYKINSRTVINKNTSEDIRYWTYQDFNNKITNLYTESLKEKKNLFKLKSNGWYPILTSQNNGLNNVTSIELTPTMYDVIYNSYINFLTDHRNKNSKINLPNALKYCDDLALINKENSEKNAELFFLTKKIELQKKKFSDKEYIVELEKLSKLYNGKTFYNGYIYYLLAKQISFQKDSLLDSYKRVENIRNVVKDFYPNSEELKAIEEILNNYKKKNIAIGLDNTIIPNKINPIKISHTNTDKIFVKIYQLPITLQNEHSHINKLSNLRYTTDYNKITDYLNTLNLIEDYSIQLKDFKDLNTHSTIVKFNALNAGNYLAVFSTVSDLTKVSKQEAYQLINFTSANEVINIIDNKLIVVDRETGNPYKNAIVEVLNDRNSNIVLEYKTNELGIVEIDNLNNYVSAKLKNGYGIYSKYIYKNIVENDATIKGDIFTDRAIYRPGQLVYFKGIVYDKKDYLNNVISSRPVIVNLLDVSGKEINNLKLTTNEFGSVNGHFLLPVSVLTGNFTLEIALENKEIIGSKNISVEEYKRPRFQVKINKENKNYSLNKEVLVNGNASTYAGAPLIGTPVKYNVYRKQKNIYQPWYRGFTSIAPAQEVITYGEIVTDVKGNYSFSFNAKSPIENIEKGENLFYDFVVDVTITDINGEMQTTSSTIVIGNKPFVISINTPDLINNNDFKNISITVDNFNDQKLTKNGKLEIYSLNSPKGDKRSKKFTTDYNYYSREEFELLFPNENYGNESDVNNWKENEIIYSTTFASSTIALDGLKNLKEDYYLIKATIEENGEKIVGEKIIYINNPKQKHANVFLNVTTDKEEYKVGDKVIVDFKTAFKDGFVYYQLQTKNKVLKSGLLDLSKSNKLTFNVDSSFIGDAFLTYIFTKINDVKAEALLIKVPVENKELKVETTVFRDLLAPGQKEKWQLKISGNKKEKITAEVLATMYDASLDQFVSNDLNFNPNNFKNYNNLSNLFNITQNFKTSFSDNLYYIPINDYYINYSPLIFNLYNISFNDNYNIRPYAVRGISMRSKSVDTLEMASLDEAILSNAPSSIEENSVSTNNLNNILPRKVLEETAFFYPNLLTDKDGNLLIEFISPEALTEWKFMALAYTKDLKVGYLEKTAKTQKDLMLTPNVPRFLREGDKITLTAKIDNLSLNNLNGKAQLNLFDAFTMQPLEGLFNLNEAEKVFYVTKENSTVVSWQISVPKNVNAIIYRMVAKAGDFSDGEESALPVLTNRMLVTETLPLYIKENQEKTFNLENLANSQSNTLDNYKLTLEITTNPIWNAVFALPYLREYPYECAEQVFSRFYGNLVSMKIIQSNPKIKNVFDLWNSKNNLKSKLQLNQELKSILLEETPWLINAENEATQQKQIATLFQLNQMQQELSLAYEKLSNKQLENGGFAWFDGGQTNSYIITYIVSGFGNLKKMGIDLTSVTPNSESLIANAINYIDRENHNVFIDSKNNLLQKEYIPNGTHYLYARSFFLKEYPIPTENQEMVDRLIEKLKDIKSSESVQQKSMAAIVLFRFGYENEAKKIINNLKETAVFSDELGMYWKKNVAGWYWYDAPVETQAYAIEAFDEVSNDVNSIEELKIWLLKNKQTNQWNSTKATTKAVYALLNTGKSWINAEEGINVKIGDKTVDLKGGELANAGYVKTVYNANEITKQMANVTITKSSPGIAWGGLYWQYFEDLDKIKSSETGLKINKQLFVKQQTANGKILTPINDFSKIKIGDVVTIRLEISTDRVLNFVHLKDMRASGFEPTQTLSGYNFQGGLGYYTSTRDAATNFFIDYMPKGSYVFEYDLKANLNGVFSNGITTIQNMYAPELSSHTKGINIEIE